MAIYHLSIKVIGRSHGKSAVSAAAYRAGERLCDYDIGTVHDYTHKGGVILSEIILPENAPESYRDRETLWNSVQKIEKNANWLARSRSPFRMIYPGTGRSNASGITSTVLL